jgi:hypothetical protein
MCWRSASGLGRRSQSARALAITLERAKPVALWLIEGSPSAREVGQDGHGGGQGFCRRDTISAVPLGQKGVQTTVFDFVVGFRR